jgi:hypothetical protein
MGTVSKLNNVDNLNNVRCETDISGTKRRNM